jgi:hypothetical protein
MGVMVAVAAIHSGLSMLPLPRCDGLMLRGKWHHVSISDATKTYSIDAFALAMALLEIARTAMAPAEQKAEGNDADG